MDIRKGVREFVPNKKTDSQGQRIGVQTKNRERERECDRERDRHEESEPAEKT